MIVRPLDDVVAVVATVLLLPLLLVVTSALDNGVGLRPPMGWNSWNQFHCAGLNETVVRNVVDAFVKRGYRDAGYRYVNLDDCWQIGRDNVTHEIVVDGDKFPSGIKALADYAHSHQLKFGLYSDAGYRTCAGRPGSLGYEDLDAETYARDWNVDLLKYDNCNYDGSNPVRRMAAMTNALNRTGRPVLMALCDGGWSDAATWGRYLGNTWRTTPDIEPDWRTMRRNILMNDRWSAYAGYAYREDGQQTVGWNDPDMLEVGVHYNNISMTLTEWTTHFSLWCIAKAPLIMGADLATLPDNVREILLNREAIAINQDELGVQGKLLTRLGDDAKLEVWGGPVSGEQNRGAGEYALLFVNLRDRGSLRYVVDWSTDLPMIPELHVEMTARDLWRHRDFEGTIGTRFAVQLDEPHQCLFLRLSKNKMELTTETTTLAGGNVTNSIDVTTAVL